MLSRRPVIELPSLEIHLILAWERPSLLISRKRLLGMKAPKVIVEKHSDGYVAYPLGMKGAVVGQGDTYDEALADVRSAIQFHVETFGVEAFGEDDVLEAFVAESGVFV